MTRCAVVDKATGRVANVIMADPAVDKPYRGTVFVVLADDERCDSRFAWDGTRTGALRFRPVPEFEAEYYEGIRIKGVGAKEGDVLRESRYPAGSPEQAAYDAGYDGAVVRTR